MVAFTKKCKKCGGRIVQYGRIRRFFFGFWEFCSLRSLKNAQNSKGIIISLRFVRISF